MKKSAFTLIELLVVITIIAILAGIALPVFSGVQEKARATQDSNNLRQLGIGTTAYFNDHDDTIFSLTGTSYSVALNPKYIAVWKSFQSPFDKRPPSELPATAPVSYDLNKNLAGKNCSDVVSPSNCIMFAPLLATLYPNITFTRLSTDLPALDGSTSNGSGATGGTQMKGKRINVMFVDAHVETMLMADFHDTPNPLKNSDASAPIQFVRWNK